MELVGAPPLFARLFFWHRDINRQGKRAAAARFWAVRAWKGGSSVNPLDLFGREVPRSAHQGKSEPYALGCGPVLEISQQSGRIDIIP
jgi:hypothetical protein